jgi:hypothetical protein
VSQCRVRTTRPRPVRWITGVWPSEPGGQCSPQFSAGV